MSGNKQNTSRLMPLMPLTPLAFLEELWSSGCTRHSNSARPRAIAMCAQLRQRQGAWFPLFNGNAATMPYNAWLTMLFGKGLDKLILSDDVSSAVSSNVKQSIFFSTQRSNLREPSWSTWLSAAAPWQVLMKVQNLNWNCRGMFVQWTPRNTCP